MSSKILELIKVAKALVFTETYSFQSPIMLAINLTCPVVNYDDEELDNWNKYLQCLQLLLGPMVCIFLIKGMLSSPW